MSLPCFFVRLGQCTHEASADNRASIGEPMEIIDLSMPIGEHFRWSPKITVKGDIAAGDQFRITHLATTCHGFTHVDAQAHFVAHAPTIEATPLGRVVGPARVFNLRDVEANTAIDAARLAKADPGGAEGEIFLLSSGWDTKRDNTHGGILEGRAVSHARGRRVAAMRRSRARSRSTFRRTMRSGCCSTATSRRRRSTSRTTRCCARA